MSLAQIQKELKAPKNQRNTFGNYNYRSCEDIVEAVKPLLHDYKYSLILSDDIVAIGDRIYVKATAYIVDENNNPIHMASAYARESAEKKGMDSAQLTGACSSYARKYALNGLFAIDDTKDMDTNEANKPERPPISAGKRNKYIKAINDIVDRADELGAKEIYDELCEVPEVKDYVKAEYLESEQNFKGGERLKIFMSLVNGGTVNK